MTKFIVKNKILIIIIIFLAIFGIGFLTSHTSISKPINNLEYKDTIAGKMSVYDFMNTLKSQGKINFTEINYIGMGKFIETINGVKGNGEKNWIYYVNGVEAQVGVSNYKIKMGDIVSWKYEKANY
jgi:hypothetical protein